MDFPTFFFNFTIISAAIHPCLSVIKNEGIFVFFSLNILESLTTIPHANDKHDCPVFSIMESI